jgi:hypothetical protein
MSKQVRFRRGTTAQHSVFTGPAGEITVDTDEKALVVHDGVVAGGVPIARADRPRGMTRIEYFTSNGTYSISGKTDLKRIRVFASGGGGGGSSTASGCGGAEGGHGVVTIEATSLPSTVAVTIGSGGGANASGGTTSFGTFISCTGGGSGPSNSQAASSDPGSASGSGVLNLGAQAGTGGVGLGSAQGRGGGPWGGGAYGTAGKGFFGGGGGPASGSGGAGGVMIEEIYGYV